MSLSLGTRLGPYEIGAQIGAGGMGEVYRATDTNLKRQVAIKVLPESLDQDPDRLARFQREAEVLAALNHPNIAHIHGLEKAEGTFALVMELVEGPTLADRIALGPIPPNEALPIAKQIAEALEAAHEQGIIHRDLKPANIKVREDGTVKVLDFGLAKLVGPVSSAQNVNVTASPTITSPAMMTGVGVILGTAAYMSPEQAAGKPVDKRSDIWAFGVVLFEMLTGRRLFDGETVPHVLAAVLKTDPDWTMLPPGTPVSIRTLLRRCLDRDRKRRLDSAAAARLEIDDALSAPAAGQAAAVPFPVRRGASWAIAAAVVIGLIAFGAGRTLMRPSSPPASASRFAVVLPPGQQMPSILLDRDIAISPDGRQLVYRVGGSTGGGPLALRGLDELEPRLLPGIDNARAPFFSPDGRWIGFFADSELNAGSELKKVSTAGGPAIIVSRSPSFPIGSGSWGDDDTITFAAFGSGLFRVSSAGGEPAALAVSEKRASSVYAFTSMLPGGRGVLFTVKPEGTWFTSASDSQVTVLDLRTGQSKTLTRGSSPRYVPVSAQTGYLVYASAGTLLAARFDLNRLSILGDPVPVVEHVAMAQGGAVDYDISRTGTLVYVPAGLVASRSLIWVDRAGHETPTKLPPRAYALVRLSPDGTQVVLTGAEDRRIWIGDLGQETLRGLTFGSSEDGFPIWASDSRSIIFTSNRDGHFNLYSQPADGSGPAVRLTMSPNEQFPNSAARDGRQILGAEFTSTSFLDVVLFAAPGSAQTAGSTPNGPVMPFVMARPLVKTPAQEYDAIISPDGRFFAYQSNESGRFEVYVKPLLPTGDVRWQVSTSGGSSPLWAPKGRELYYRDVSNAVIAVPFETNGATFQAGTPVKLLDPTYAAPTDMFNYDVSPDGQRFLMLKETSAGEKNAAPVNIVVVLNWLEELKQRVATK